MTDTIGADNFLPFCRERKIFQFEEPQFRETKSKSKREKERIAKREKAIRLWLLLLQFVICAEISTFIFVDYTQL
ncbi:hypothetical protein LXL04_002692 [Taraxacum kok-saghyz]